MPSEQLERAYALWRSLIPKGEATINDTRASVDSFFAGFRVPDDVEVQPVDAAGFRAIWVSTPESSRERTVIYLHGGGYVLGSARNYCEMASRVARAARARVLVIDYRLAPEHPFPAPVEDALAAYRWLISNGANPASTVIAGDSAGGGLTLATLVTLRDVRDRLPAAGICISPWVDLEAIGESMESNASVDPLISREMLCEMAATYLAGENPKSPMAAPLYADLRGLPPLLIQVGTWETLLDDALRITERARAAGVDVTLEQFERAPHVWHVFASFLPEGQQAIERIGEFILEHTKPIAQAAGVPL
jgi:monoterpene epsilon-lactone hydrolase